jgi:hypothetical protein
VRTRSVTGKVSTEKATVNVPQFQADKVTLRWEHYPSERQRGLIGGDLLDGVRDTIYDLKVWIVDPSGIASVVYGRRGITETSHLIEIPLRPGPVYYWSVRARFHYRDRDAATPWSGTSTPQDPTCAVFPFPDTRRFRFRTRVD